MLHLKVMTCSQHIHLQPPLEPGFTYTYKMLHSPSVIINKLVTVHDIALQLKYLETVLADLTKCY